MNPAIKRTQRDYSLAFKLALVDQAANCLASAGKPGTSSSRGSDSGKCMGGCCSA